MPDEPSWPPGAAGGVTKRVTLPIGAVGSNAVTTVPEFNPRQLVSLPAPTTRWRLRFLNFLGANASPIGAGLGTFACPGVALGVPTYPAVTSEATSGRWAGKCASLAAVPAISPFNLVDGTEHTTEWVTDPALQFVKGTPAVLSWGMLTSGTWEYGGDSVGGQTFQGAGTSAAFATPAPVSAATAAIYMDVRLEYETVTTWPVVLFIGDSLTQGISGGDGGCVPHESFPGAAALRNRFLQINAGVAGAQSANFTVLADWHYTRLDLATTVPDAAVIMLGVNEGFNSSTLTTNIAAIIANLRSIGINRIYLCTAIPNNYSVASEAVRRPFNAWARAMPLAIEGVIDFDKAMGYPGGEVLTTGTGTGAPALTFTVTNAVGINQGAVIALTGLPTAVTVSSISGTTITASGNITVSAGGQAVTFYNTAPTSDPELATAYPHPLRPGYQRMAEVIPAF